MKKFICMVMVAMMVVSVAFAECVCTPNSVVRYVADRLVWLDVEMTNEELIAVTALSIGENEDCASVKTALLNVILRNYDSVLVEIGNQKLAMVVEYIGHCCCGNCNENSVENIVVEPTPSPAPTVSHRHHGGNHSNGGRCVECHAAYQSHNVTWVSKNNSNHIEKCECGWTGKEEVHKAGELICYEGDNLALYKCTVCNANLYWHIIRDYERTDNCCDCHCGPCCEGCECGCTKG